MSNDESRYWKNSTVELRAAGFDPKHAANLDAVVTIGNPYTNAHRCNNRVRQVADLLIETLATHNAQGLVVGTPAVSDALTQGTSAAGYSLVSRDLIADCVELAHNTHHGNSMLMISGCDKVGAAALMPLARTNACGAMFTANTMSTIAEAMGMMMPRGASHPADYDAHSSVHADVKKHVAESATALMNLKEKGIRPRDIMTMAAF